jgi:hypothetical protein
VFRRKDNLDRHMRSGLHARRLKKYQDKLRQDVEDKERAARERSE